MSAASVKVDWPMLGGSAGVHRMAGRISGKVVPTSTMVVAAKLEVLKQEGAAAIARREQTAAALKAATIQRSDIFLDEAASIVAQEFPLDEATLIAKCKEFLYFDQGIKAPGLLDASFVFMGPYVGGASGLPKQDFLDAVGGFDIRSAFPDINPRFHHFRIDPMDPGRVWFTSQASGTDTGGFLGNAPTGKRFETPPQACSVKIGENGLVTKYTIGHVMERSIGNTGGLGGIFGPAYAIGKPLPFPEANPWKPSKRYRALMLVGKLAGWLKKRAESK